MRRVLVGLVGLTLAAVGAAVLPSAPAQSAAPVVANESVPPTDDLPNPLAEKRNELREQAVSEVLNGRLQPEQRNGSTVVKVGETASSGTENARGRAAQGKKDQYVELAREKTDRIFVILAEFGNERHPSYPDMDIDPATPGPTRFDGPLHNADPAARPRGGQLHRVAAGLQPGATSRTCTSAGGESLKNYYETQSSGRYSVNGEVTDWVKVQYNEARYGRSDGFPCGGNVCTNTWALVRTRPTSGSPTSWPRVARPAGHGRA